MKLGMRKTTPREPEWWLDCGNIATLYLWLVDEGDIEPNDADAVAYFISKPWKWDLEYRAMLEANREDLTPLLQASVALARGAKRR